MDLVAGVEAKEDATKAVTEDFMAGVEEVVRRV